MKKRMLTLPLLSLAICGYAQAQADCIEGNPVMKINETSTFEAPKNETVARYDWTAPIGCKVVSGQGTPSVEISSSFLSQDSPVRLIRTFTDEHKDTLETPIKFCRYVQSIQDHTIAPGETINIGGKDYSEADIYYTPAEGENACGQVVAHRLTVEPKTGSYANMTKPYLQSAEDTAIWISWKTSFENTPKVIYGTSKDQLTQTLEGSIDNLSEDGFPYYWNSIRLTGLQPNTVYYYQAISDNKKSEVCHFRTMPTPKSHEPMRILLMGDHQIKSRSGYEWLMKAAQRKIEEKYGDLTENINMIMNIGDQVDVGTLDQYEQIHLFKSQLMSPYLPIMTAVGNHETYNDPGMQRYAAHYHYENLTYQGISSGTENYYAYQAGRILFVVLSTEHTGDAQKEWVRKIVDAAKKDDSVDFIISVNHRPIQAEQYVGDISAWVRNEIIPILSETPKHVLNYGGHHHLYHRGQLTDYPLYHIINGAASWDQMWGMSSEQDYDDVQKTIDYWGYQILEFDFDKKEMKAECYAIGNKELVVDNILIDSFSRTLGKAAPKKPEIKEITEETITLPYTFKGSPYKTTTDEQLNSVQYQFSLNQDFSTIEYNKVRDVEDLYGSTGKPLHIPIDLNENIDITQLTIEKNKLINGTYYVRMRYRDTNMEWSEWSDTRQFTVEGSIAGKPSISITDTSVIPGETITIDYKYTPEGQNAWIGIYRKGEEPHSVLSYKWKYTPAQSGSMNFTIDETNEYYAVLFEDEGYTEISERIPFYVGPEPQISLEKSEFEEGEDIVVTYSNAPGLKNDWIGIYKRGEIPGTSDTSDSWDYLGGNTEGTLTLAKDLPKGYYFLNYFTLGQYFEPRERVYFSVGKDISSLSTDKTEFSTDEAILIHYKDGPGTPKDWVGVYKDGKDPNVDELDGFYYTYGATEGTVSIKAGTLEPGNYFSALFINDSYDEVSPRIQFTIKDGTGIRQAKNEDGPLFYPNANGSLRIEGNTYETADIFNLAGNCVRRTTLTEGNCTIDFADLPAGIYIFKFHNGTDNCIVHKVIKK